MTTKSTLPRLAAACHSSHHARGNGAKGIGGSFGDRDGLEGEVGGTCSHCAPRCQKGARRTQLAHFQMVLLP